MTKRPGHWIASAVVLSCGLLLSSAAALQREPVKWALLVGVQDYDNPEITPLRYAVSDVKAVGEALKTIAGFDRVYVMTSDIKEDPDRPTHVNIVEKLDGLANRIEAEDTFLFYFSGHGFSREGRNFLATVNSKPATANTLEVTSVPIPLLQQQVSRIKARQRIFILDCCRNDPDADKGTGDNVRSPGLSKDLVRIAEPSKTTSTTDGTALLFACSEGERAYEWPEKQRSVFTHFLLEGMRGPAVDPSGRLGMTRLGTYVRDQVVAWSTERLAARKKTQTPDLRKFGAAELVLVDGVAPPGGGPVVLPRGARVLITSKPPGARVSLGDRETGRVTPTAIGIGMPAVSQRSIRITLSLAGYKTEEKFLAIEKGKTHNLDVALVREAAPRIQIRTRVNEVDGATMAYVPAGEFLMGSDTGDLSEGPPHRVRLTHGFWLYRAEVTNAQFAAFLKANPGYRWLWRNRRFDGPEQPVVGISWDDAAAYCQWAKGRLPTEAEWELAARGADGRQYPWGDEPPDNSRAVFGMPQSTGKPGPVGVLPAGASPFGLLDMAGNVWEWCADRFGYDYYRISPPVDPTGPTEGTRRVARGGSWANAASRLRVTDRRSAMPTDRPPIQGFRPARSE